jgi:hypothetical protein
MATQNFYDLSTGLTKPITIDVASSVVKRSQVGGSQYYIVVSTTAKDISGGTVPTIYITDGDIENNLTTAVKEAIVELFRHIAGTYLSSSSSESTVELSYSTSSETGSSSSSFSKSSSTQHKGSSSSSTSVSSSSTT